MVHAAIITLGALMFGMGLVLVGTPRWEAAGWAKYIGLSAAIAALAALTSDWSDVPAVRLASLRAEGLALCLFLAAYVEHAHLALGDPTPPRWTRLALGVVVAGATLLQVPGLALQEHAVSAGGSLRPSPALWGLVALSIGVATATVARLMRRLIQGSAVAPVVAGLGAFLVAGVADLARIGLGLDGPFLLPGALLVPLILESHAFVAQVADDARRLGTLHQRLVEDAESGAADLSDVRESLAHAERLGTVGRLAAGVAHEINNPAAVVQDNLGHALDRVRRAADLDDVRMALEDAVVATDRIVTVVHQLQVASAAAQGPAEPAESVLLRDVVGRSLRARPLRLPVGVRLDVDIDPELRVHTRPAALEDVLVHLVQNALRAIQDRGEGRGTIWIVGAAAACDEDVARIEVRDDGVGMGETIRDRLFEPFFTTRPFGEGSGLGLAVSRGLVRSMGGSMSVRSAEGEGTAVALHLPRGSGDGATARASSAPTLGLPSPEPSPAVLLVEDDALVRRALARRLSRAYRVELAGSVSEAKERLARSPTPAVVLCDVMMNDGGGPALYEAIERAHPQLAARFVFVTGGATDRRARDFLGRQQQPVLHKPLDLDELARAHRRLDRPGPALEGAP